MANLEQLEILKQGVKVWNIWREEHPDVNIDLRGADLRKMKLIRANLTGANLKGADLSEANLSFANLRGANLRGANLKNANFWGAALPEANLKRTDLRETILHNADLRGATFRGADLRGTKLRGADIEGVAFTGEDLRLTDWEEEMPPKGYPSGSRSPEIPEPRYADFRFFDNERKEIPEGGTLQAGQWYLLEVAVRVKPQGVPSEELERDPIREPQQTHAVTIMVTAEGDGFDIAEPVQTLTLPPRGDSTHNAEFKVRPEHKLTNAYDLAEIRVRLYYEFNLLEVVIIRTEIVGKFDDTTQSRLGLAKPISFIQERVEQEYIDFDHVQPRIMHIDISRKEKTFLLNFAFYNEEDQEIVFPAPIHLLPTDLEDALIDVRKIWYAIAMSKTFTEQLEGDKDEFLEHIQMLAEAGLRLWGRLFRQKGQSAVYEIGVWLEKHPLQQDGIIQISLTDDAADFVFPWALLYQPSSLLSEQSITQHDTPVDVYNFWGIRYCIEQKFPDIVKCTDAPIQLEKPLKVDFMIWDQFRNAQKQKRLMQAFIERSAGKLEISIPPINDAKRCYSILNNCDSQILYFYTHGYTRHRRADIDLGPDLDVFLRRYESLEADSPLRESYKILYESIKQKSFEENRSWIELSYGKVYLDTLSYDVRNIRSGPVVILNMCESAQLTPSLSDGFFHFFLDRGARSVIGTECPMTVEFAHPFAEKILQEIFSGKQIGMALLDVRRHFIEEFKNPLGLAYTLFGLATVAFEPPVF